MWRVCGWQTEGDRFFGAQSLAWGLPLERGEAPELWNELGALAEISDQWQVSRGRDSTPPSSDYGDFFQRPRPTLSQVLLPASYLLSDRQPSVALARFLKLAYGELQKWRRTRQPPRLVRPLIPTSSGGGGALLIAAVVVIALRKSRK